MGHGAGYQDGNDGGMTAMPSLGDSTVLHELPSVASSTAGAGAYDSPGSAFGKRPTTVGGATAAARAARRASEAESALEASGGRPGTVAGGSRRRRAGSRGSNGSKGGRARSKWRTAGYAARVAASPLAKRQLAHTTIGERRKGKYLTALGGSRSSKEVAMLQPKTKLEMLRSRSAFLDATAKRGTASVSGVRFAFDDPRNNGERLKSEKPIWVLGTPEEEHQTKVPDTIGPSFLSDMRSPGSVNFGTMTRNDKGPGISYADFNPDVGPGTYETATGLGKQALSTRKNPHGVPFREAGQPPLSRLGLESPGPSHMPPSQFGQKGAGRRISKSRRQPIWDRGIGPGPAAFVTDTCYERLTNAKPSPSFSFGVAKRKSPAIVGRAPGPIYSPPHRSSYSPSFSFGTGERKSVW